jgi:ssDNA-binding Zn-finger/Zn-ribbon topoisomerase 1
MEIISDGPDSLRIERCSECLGFYFNQLTKTDLLIVEDKKVMDTASVEAELGYDDVVYVECPKCDKIMEQLKTVEPVQIRFENCPSCHSAFLDAGEFQQYLTDGYRNEFRAMLPD